LPVGVRSTQLATAVWRGVSPVLLRSFSVLARARYVSDSSDGPALPASIASHLTLSGAPAAELQLVPASAQFVQLNSAFAVWVVPGATGVCLVRPESAPGGTSYVDDCTTTSNATDGGLVVDVTPGHGSPTDAVTEVYGLAPNGDSTVSVVATSGAVESVPVVDNVYDYVVPSGAAEPAVVKGQSASGGSFSTNAGLGAGG
jgi:hypothetical protein